MAKKDENEFSYGASFLPKGEKKYSVIRWGWNGLNRTDDIDTGQLTEADGVICDPPYMVSAHKYKELVDLRNGLIPYGSGLLSAASKHVGIPNSIYGFGGILYLVWHDTVAETVSVTKFVPLRDGNDHWDTFYIGSFKMESELVATPEDLRTVIRFNVVDTSSGNIAAYTYDEKVAVYPDCYSENAISYPNYTQANSFDTGGNTVPYTKYATVYGSRVFGVNSNAVHASAYNSYVDYTLDTADDISSAHAWYSLAQSNPEADSGVTAVTTYDNHVVIFRSDFMQLVYNNKNPFRIVDVGEFGCDNQKALTIMNGVLYFASNQKVYAYTGGTPKDISSKLEVGDLSGAVLGSYKDTLWMQTKDTVYTYKNGTWSNLGKMVFGGATVKILQFATLDYGLAALVDYYPGHNTSWGIVLLDWDNDMINPASEDESAWEPQYTGNWWFETDLMALGKLDIRRVKKFTTLCEGKKNAEFSVYLFPDSAPHTLDAENYNVGSVKFDADGMKMLRVLTRQFSSTMHRLRFVGKGYVKFYAAELKISWGGDVYVEG